MAGTEQSHLEGLLGHALALGFQERNRLGKIACSAAGPLSLNWMSMEFWELWVSSACEGCYPYFHSGKTSKGCELRLAMVCVSGRTNSGRVK